MNVMSFTKCEMFLAAFGVQIFAVFSVSFWKYWSNVGKTLKLLNTNTICKGILFPRFLPTFVQETYADK